MKAAITLEKFLNNNKVSLADALTLMAGCRRVDFGGKENNIGQIGFGSDPIAALTERLTNATDAVTDRFIHDAGVGDRKFVSPQEARNFLTSANPKLLKDKIFVNVQLPHGSHGTGAKENMYRNSVVDVEDRGIGISPTMASETILSLSGSNKIRSKHYIGCYGQGGSATFNFVSRRDGFTLITSRDGNNNVWFTIVFYEEPSEATNQRQGKYVYLVDADGRVPCFKAEPFKADPSKKRKSEDPIGSVKDLQQGTLVRHHRYNLSQYHKHSMNEFSPYTGFLNFMPKPLYTINYFISSEAHSRSLPGLDTMLSDSVNYDYAEERLSFPPMKLSDPTSGESWGSVQSSVYILKPKVERDPGTGGKTGTTILADPKLTVLITLNGQLHGREHISALSSDIGKRFDYLKTPKGTDIVVIIKVDGLSWNARAELLATTREHVMRNMSVWAAIQKKVAPAILEAPELATLNEKRKAASMKNVKATAVSGNVFEFVSSSFLTSKQASAYLATAGPGKGKVRARREAEVFEDITPNPKGPTTLRTRPGQDYITLHLGKVTSIMLESNAPNGWGAPFSSVDTDKCQKAVKDIAFGEWVGGRLRVDITCKDDIDLDQVVEGVITFSFNDKVKAEVLYEVKEAEARGEAREKRPKQGSGGTQVYVPKGRIVPVVPGDDHWQNRLGLERADGEWFAFHVNALENGDFELFIYYDYVLLKKVVKGLNKAQEAAVKAMYKSAVEAAALKYANNQSALPADANEDQDRTRQLRWSESAAGYALLAFDAAMSKAA
jgi:hypothetical protein